MIFCATHRNGHLLRRSGVRSGTRGFTFWMVGLSLFLLVLRGSFTLAGLALRGAMSVVLV
jgi:hypothetical protein